MTIARSDEVRVCCDWQSRGQYRSDDDYGGDDDEEEDKIQVWKIHHDHHHDNQECDL